MITLERPDAGLSKPYARWLALARRVWYGTAAIALSLVLVSVPTYSRTLGVLTDAERDLIEIVAPATLLSPSPAFEFWIDGAITLTSLGASLLSLGLAALIFRRRSNDRTGLLASFTLLLYGVVMTGPLEFLLGDIADAALIAISAQAVVWFPFMILIYVFPDGKFVPPVTRRLAFIVIPLGIALALVMPDLYQGVDDFKLAAFVALYTLFSLTAPAAQVYRYVRVATEVQRQQIKWVVMGFTIAIAGGTIVPSILLYALGQLPAGAAPDVVSMGLVFFGRMAWWLGLFALPLSITIAILRYRLWGIDVILNRALVYGSLTLMVVGLYVFIVGYLGTLFHIPGHMHQAVDLVVSLIATAIVAVIFQPLRDRLQRSVNRLMYGERDDPYAVLSRLGHSLQVALAPDAVLPTIVETVAESLRIPCVAIALKEADGFKIVAAYPPAPVPSEQGARVEDQESGGEILPLAYQNEVIGQLIFARRAPGESFMPAERRLLQDIAQQAGVAAHAVRLTQDLQRSRERLVTAREEERRRLRRDLHDGLGPQLASQTLTLTAARQLLRVDPDAADALLAEAIRHAQDAITDIRRVVHDLRPPVLDDLGLVAALRAQAARYEHSGVQVTVAAPERLPPLPAAVEVACYRIAQEALTNVVRHAQAHQCQVRLALGCDDGKTPSRPELRLEITDDGVGLPRQLSMGVGLTSMRERAAELGGTCAIDTMATGGTRVAAHLPIGG